MWLRTSTLGLLFDLGRWDELLAEADAVIAWDRAHGGDYVAVEGQRYQALVHVWRGELAAASSILVEMLPKAREIDDLQQLVPALVVAALVEEGRGDRTAALALVEEVERVTGDRAGGHQYRGQHLPDLVRLCADAAPSLARKLIEHGHVDVARHRIGALTARAVLAETGGDLAEAGSLYRQAAEGWSSYGNVLEHGLALFGAGRCLGRLGRGPPGGACQLHRSRRPLPGRRGQPPAPADLSRELLTGEAQRVSRSGPVIVLEAMYQGLAVSPAEPRLKRPPPGDVAQLEEHLLCNSAPSCAVPSGVPQVLVSGHCAVMCSSLMIRVGSCRANLFASACCTVRSEERGTPRPSLIDPETGEGFPHLRYGIVCGPSGRTHTRPT